MKFQTEDGREMYAGVYYDQVTIPRYPDQVCRRTNMYLRSEGNAQHPGVAIEVHSICCPGDQFCRKDGRNRARSQFLDRFLGRKAYEDLGVKNYFTRKDRTLIYKAIAPEFKRHDDEDKRKRAEKRYRTWNTTLTSIPTEDLQIVLV